MRTTEFYTKIDSIRQKDHRYSSEAYEFVNDAVFFTIEKYEKRGRKKHISAEELLDGICDFALKQFGPMAYEVFMEWGIVNSSAIGDIVFNMIDQGILSRSDDDSIENFRDAIDFKKELLSPFLPDNNSSTHSHKIA